ncbi:MAG: polysaccharide deacetylase family protein [Thermoanaerobaculia bacterium]
MQMALKVDCDTAIGTRDGVPRLLRLFDRHGIRATFFFSLGPDRSGRAALRVFTRRGFLRKMLRSRAPSLYPWRTMFSGTLLPAPKIAAFAKEQIRSAADAGHEVGVHAWDHVSWHDRLPRWDRERTSREYGLAMDSFALIFGRPASASACAGWTVSEAYLAARETYPLLYTSDTRGGSPFRPRFGLVESRIPEIPSTLPTLDERIGDPAGSSADELLAEFRDLASDRSVHTVHTEVEGGPYLAWFDRLLSEWRGRGATFVPLETLARESAENPMLPARRIGQITLPGRAGTVASGFDESMPEQGERK